MTALPQTHRRISQAQEGRRRIASANPESSGAVKGRARQALPTIDSSTAFGCVDWFLYPDQAVGRSAAET
jgi:hypothetical protein